MVYKKSIYVIIILVLITSCTKQTNFDQQFSKIMDDEIIDVNKAQELSKYELRILRNLIFAKFGYEFRSDDLNLYFYSDNKPYGYTFNVSNSFNEDQLSNTDRENLNIILQIEDRYKTKLAQEEEKSEEKVENNDLDINSLSCEQIYYILNEDIISYFPEMKSKYNTDLQRKHFKESEDYTKLKPIMDNLRNRVLENQFRKNVTGSITFEK